MQNLSNFSLLMLFIVLDLMSNFNIWVFITEQSVHLKWDQIETDFLNLFTF